MIKKAILTVSSFFATFFVIAQPPAEKSLLWKIEGNGLKQPSYLYGTIHIMCPSDINISSKLESAFNSTKQLYLELDLDDPATIVKMMTGMMMTDGSSIKSLLSEADFAAVSEIFKTTTGMPLEMLASAKPIMLMSLIYPSLLGCAPEGWEQAFIKLAKEKNIEVFGLEAVEDQLRVLDAIPYPVQAEMFRKTMLNLDSARQVFTQMVMVYKDQNIQEMITMTRNDEDFGAYEEDMLNKRNQNWIPIMATAMKKMPSFFAVGAAHLGGDKGVINLLRQAGYRVTPVK